MATVYKTITIDAPPAVVWDALRDFHAVHQRIAPGFVTGLTSEGDVRIVTFSNGSVAREKLVSCDDTNRRLTYWISSERMIHHNASAQVFAEPNGTTRFVWITDVLPDEIAPYIDSQMSMAVPIMKQTLERAAKAA